MGHQDEALLFLQVGRHHGARFGVQVVGGLVDEQKVPLVQKQGGQQDLGLLPVGEACERAVQHVGPHPQQGELPFQLPAGRAGADAFQHRPGGPVLVGNGVGEVVEGGGGADGAAVFIFAQQQLEKRGLAAAIAADEAQLPAGVQLQAHVLKDGVEAGRVGKRQMFDLDQCQGATLLCTKTGRRKVPAAVCAQSSPCRRRADRRFAPLYGKRADGMGHFLQPGTAMPLNGALCSSVRSAGKMTHPSTPFVSFSAILYHIPRTVSRGVLAPGGVPWYHTHGSTWILQGQDCLFYICVLYWIKPKSHCKRWYQWNNHKK